MHATALGSIADARLYACADSNERRRSDFTKQFKPKKAYGDYEELLKDRDVDAVIICLPNFLHFPASLAALEAGKHVLCEKPPTLNAAEMKVLRAEAGKRNLTYSFSRQFRFSPGNARGEGSDRSRSLRKSLSRPGNVHSFARHSSWHWRLVHGEKTFRRWGADRYRHSRA